MVAISFLFNPNKKAGSRIKLQIMAINKVTDTNMPKAWVPLKVDAVKIKHNLPNRTVCVSSLGHREEGIRLAKLIDADYKDVPNYCIRI